MTKNILVVDDSFIMRTIIKDIVESDPELKVVGFAENGKVGLQKTRELKPDALILDLEMPGMDGLQLQQRLRVDGHIFPIIMLTAHGAAAARIQALRAGAVAFLQKPCDSEVLLATVESVRQRGGRGRTGH